MQKRRTDDRPPVVLIVDDKEWSTRSLESVLAPSGYAVMRAYTAKQGLERAQVHPPDAVFVSTKLPDGDGVQFCRSLRDTPQFGASIPIIVTSAERPTRETRLTALQAGAWDVVSYPIDAQELKLRIEAYVRAKFEAERARDQCLVDQLTGLYNLRGLERRDRELRSQAYREQQPLACVVLSLSSEENAEPTEAESREAIVRMGNALRQTGRISDAIGRLGPMEFAIIAPSTDARGAEQLAERLAQAIDRLDKQEGATAHPRLRFHAGYDAVPNVREKPVEARDLMLHATMALRSTKTNGERISGF